MTAGNKDIIIEQGATFILPLIWKDGDNIPINLTGYTAALMVRRKYEDASPVLSLTSACGIVLGGITGTIAITASAGQTSALVEGVGVYDLKLTSAGGIVTRLLQGKATILPQATK